MLDNGVHWLCLLQLKEQLLHGLNSVITAQVYGHLFDLRKKRISGVFASLHHRNTSVDSSDGEKVIE